MPGWRMLVVGVGLALAVGCSGGDDEPSEADEEPAPTTTEEGTTAEPTTAAPTTEAPPAASPTTSPPATEPPGEPGSAPLPDAVGMDLQLAQDTMQAAGFYGLISHDATGEGRLQVLDRNWTVCDQSPAAGTPAAPDTIIDFGAVKDDETCP